LRGARGEDLQLKDRGSGNFWSAWTKHTQVKPDIVIFTGDIIDGRPFGEHKRSDFVETFEKFLRPVIDTKIAWSFTPGNHDDDGAPYSRKDLLKLYELPCCLSAGAKTFNHTVLVGPSAKECVRLWFFDSGENADERIKYTSFDLSAVQGYCALSDKYHKAGERCLGLAYFHIPFPEYAYNKPIRGKLGLFDAARHKVVHSLSIHVHSVLPCTWNFWSL